MTARFIFTFVVVLIPTKLCAEPTPPEHLDLRGSDLFRALLKRRGLEPTLLSQSGGFKPTQDTVLVILGSVAVRHENQLSDVSRMTLARGGAVLIATSGKLDLKPFFPTDRPITINGGAVRDPVAGFNGNDDQPLIRFPKPTQFLADQDLLAMTQLKRVTANRPSYLFEPLSQVFFRFGTFPDTAKVDGVDTSRLCAMGVVVPVEKMTAVVLASEGMLTNSALADRSDPRSDNFEFALHLAAYLSGGPNRTSQRTKCLFYENGVYRTDFDRVQLTPGDPDIRPSWPAIQKTLAENAEAKISELQDRDFPTRDLLRNVRFTDLLLKIVTGLAILAGLWVLRRAWSGRESSKNESVVEEPLRTADALWESKNFYSAAREKLRLQFLAWGLPDGAKPVVAISGSYFYRKRMERFVHSLGSIAFGDAPSRVSKNRWAELDARIQRVDAAIALGRLRWEAAESRS